MSYDSFRTYQKKADELKKLERDLEQFEGNIFVSGIHVLNPKFTDLRSRMGNRAYGWEGEDFEACNRKCREIREDWLQTVEAFKSGCKEIQENIERERIHYARLAMSEMDSFDEKDWLVCIFKSKADFGYKYL